MVDEIHFEDGNFEDDDSDLSRGELFRRLRKARNLSQEDVALEAGVYVRTVSRFENDEGPRADTILRFAKVIDVPPEQLGYLRRIPKAPHIQNADEIAFELRRMNDRLDALEDQVMVDTREVARVAVDKALKDFSRKLLNRLGG